MTHMGFKPKRLSRLSSVLMVVGALALAGCGSSSSGTPSAGAGQTTQHIAFAKTKFLLHAGLAFGAFHRYIYKPFRNGGFSPPSRHKAAIVKAGVAALFALHEAKIALRDAQASPTLSKLVAPLTALQRQLSGLGGRLKAGVLDRSGINSTASTVDQVGSQSASSYKAIKDAPTPSLGG
jgi:hypothetical protein